MQYFPEDILPTFSIVLDEASTVHVVVVRKIFDDIRKNCTEEFYWSVTCVKSGHFK